MRSLVLGIGGLALVLIIYMVVVHQRIRWERDRGLLARKSYGLYWALRDFLSRYAFMLLLAVAVGIVVCYFRVDFKTNSLTEPFSGEVQEVQDVPLVKTGKIESTVLEDLKAWINRLETRRRDFPENYCESVSRGLDTYSHEENQTTLIKAKIRYLNKEYQGLCASAADSEASE